MDIRFDIEQFQPNPESTKMSIIDFWESVEMNHPKLYEIAMVVYAIPPTEVEIERDFSILEFVFSGRRCKLSKHLIDDILLIKLNKDLFQIIKQEELLKETDKSTNIENLFSP